MKKLLFILFLLLMSNSAFATTYYASTSGGGAASCVDNSANVCTLTRAIVVASTGTNTIEIANGTYNSATAFTFDSGNTGASLTLQPATGATVTLTATGATRVVYIKPTMISGTIDFENINITDNDTDYSIENEAPEVNVIWNGGSITNGDATQGFAIRFVSDTTNRIRLITGGDTLTGLRTGATTNVRIAQKIVVGGSNIVVNRASMYLKRIGVSYNEDGTLIGWDYRNSDTLTATIETDNAGAPSGTPVTNGTSANVLAFDVPTNHHEWQSFSFASNVTLTASTTYWLVLKGSYTASASYYIEAQYSSADGYAAGTGATWDGTTWTNLAASADYLFAIDRAHTKNLTVTGGTFNTRNANIQASWANNITVTGNTMSSTAGGVFSGSITGFNPVVDKQFNRVIMDTNAITTTTNGALAFSIGTNTIALTYTNAFILKGNTGTTWAFTQPAKFVHHIFIYNNNIEIQSTATAPITFGIEVDGIDPVTTNYEGFDQLVMEKNTFLYSAVSHNHIVLYGIGSEGAITRNNIFKCPNGSGAGGGAWGLILKAGKQFIEGNKFYGPGPGILVDSVGNTITYNTIEVYDSTATKSAIHFNFAQDSIYGGIQGYGALNYVEDNIFVSTSSSWPAITVCDTTDCNSTGSTLGTGRTSTFWSNRIDNNIYYARNDTTMYQIGAGTSQGTATLAQGITQVRSLWTNATYSDNNSFSQYNDIQSSAIGDPGISGSTYNFTPTRSLAIGKGSNSGSNIGGSQSSGSGSGGGKMGISI